MSGCKAHFLTMCLRLSRWCPDSWFMSEMCWKGTLKKANESARDLWNTGPNVGKWIQAKLKAFMAEAKVLDPWLQFCSNAGFH